MINMSEIEKENHEYTDSGIDNIVSSYKVAVFCPYCGSLLIETKFEGYEICKKCGKHRYFGERVSFLEVDPASMYEPKNGTGVLEYKVRNITKENFINAFDGASGLYSLENREDGSCYYQIKKIIEKSVKDDEIERESGSL